MDDEPMWAIDCVVALTLGSAIIIPKTANEFAIEGNHLTLIKGNQFDGRIKTNPHKHIHKFLRICEMFKYKDTENEVDELQTAFISRFFPPALFDRILEEIRAFSQHENESLTNAWLRMKEMLKTCHGHNQSKGNIIKLFYHGLNKTTQEVLNAATGGIFLYKTPNQAYQLLEYKVLLMLDWAKNQKLSFKKTVAFADEGSSNSDTDKIMARMYDMTMKMDAQYKEFQSRSKQLNPDHNDDDIPTSREEEAKFMQTFHRTCFYSDYRDRDSNRDNWRSSERNDYNRDNYQSNSDDKPDLQKKLTENMLVEIGKFTFPADFVILEMEEDRKVLLILGRPFLHTVDTVIRIKQKQLNLGVGTRRMIFHIDSTMTHSYSNDDTCFSIDVIKKILEEDFDALLKKRSEILHSIEGTILEEKVFAEFDEFMAMTTDENTKSESDTEEPPFEKATFNTDYKIKTSLEEPPTDLELKPLPNNIKYVFLEEHSFLSVIISSHLSEQNKNKLVSILKKTQASLCLENNRHP
nr:reverse transcriptase domain-containing protein [Tanacetum cinerariifolium]